YRIDSEERIDQLHALGDGYFTMLALDPDGGVLAASGTHGKVFLLKPDRTVVTAFDFPERQGLALARTASRQLPLRPGDAGGLYEVQAGTPKDATYTSKVFDAEFPSTYGNLRWHGGGDVRFETRSGNTSKPDKTWSGWQTIARPDRVSDGGTGRVASPE